MAVSWVELIVTATIRVLGNHSASYMENSKKVVSIGIIAVNLLFPSQGESCHFQCLFTGALN